MFLPRHRLPSCCWFSPSDSAYGPARYVRPARPGNDPGFTTLPREPCSNESKKTSGVHMSTPHLSGLRSVLLSVAAFALLALPALADSQARIVRLSDVQGSVQIDKNSGMGFENAFLNLPITQGTQLKTRDTGRAEIEFEDGSTLRIAPNTTVDFSRLGLSESGQRISVVNLIEGMAYVNWLGKGGDDFSLNFSREKLALDRAAHFRVETSTTASRLAVFKGDVDVDTPSGKLELAKKKTASF